MRPLKNLGIMNHFLQALSICVFWQAEIMNAGKSFVEKQVEHW